MSISFNTTNIKTSLDAFLLRYSAQYTDCKATFFVDPCLYAVYFKDFNFIAYVGKYSPNKDCLAVSLIHSLPGGSPFEFAYSWCNTEKQTRAHQTMSFTQEEINNGAIMMPLQIIGGLINQLINGNPIS